MRLAFAMLAMLVLMMTTVASARRVKDSRGLFSIEIPDRWKYRRPDLREGMGHYYSVDSSAVISLGTYDIEGMSLDAWTQSITKGLPTSGFKVYSDNLNKVPAKRLETASPDQTTITWMAKEGSRGVGIVLVCPRSTKEDLSSIRRTLTRSFRWVK